MSQSHFVIAFVFGFLGFVGYGVYQENIEMQQYNKRIEAIKESNDKSVREIMNTLNKIDEDISKLEQGTK